MKQQFNYKKKMKVKFKILINIALFTGILFLVSSCFKTEDKDNYYTAEIEQALLKIYIDSMFVQGHDVDTTASGIYYVVIDEGEGEFAKTGDTLTVGYAGYFIDGTLFDSSSKLKDGKYKFVFGEKPMIKGWDESMTVMNKGAKIQFIVPSEFAYGSTGDFYIIPPYQTLVFVVEMFEIQPS
jgi:FKBP-type peptidyl-prolyl cis-trans isomerase FkpA